MKLTAPNPTNILSIAASPTLMVRKSGNVLFQRSLPGQVTSALGEAEVGPAALFPLPLGLPEENDLLSVDLFDHSDEADRPGLGATFNHPTEAQLFARDPEELGQFFDTLPLDVNEIREQLFNFYYPYDIEPHGAPQQWVNKGPTALMPRAVAMLAPKSLNLFPKHNVINICKGNCPPEPDYNTSSVSPVTSDFFGMNLPAGPAGAPYTSFGGGRGSIKALKVQRAGACTREQFFLDLFGGGGSDINFLDILNTALSETCSKIDELLIHNLTIVPLMRHTPGHSPAEVSAQIFLNAYLHLQAEHFGCNAITSVLYDLFVNENGALQLSVAQDPNTSFAKVRTHDVGGGACANIPQLLGPPFGFTIPGGHDRVIDFFLDMIPGKVNQKLREAQSLPSALGVSSDDLKNLLRFLGRNTGDVTLLNDFTCLPDSDNVSQCTACRPGIAPYDAGPDAELLGGLYYGHGQASDTEFCFRARQDLCNLVRLGFTASGRSPSGNTSLLFDPANVFSLSNPGCTLIPDGGANDDERILQRMIRALEATNGNGAMRHWTCKQTNTTTENGKSDTGYNHLDELSGNCLFTPPIKRLIMNPDSFQAVFWDSPALNRPSDAAAQQEEWSNASVATAYALYGVDQLRARLPSQTADNIPGDIFSVLCNYTPGGNTSAATPSKRTTSTKVSLDNQNPPFLRPFVFLLLDRLHCPREAGGQCEYRWASSESIFKLSQACYPNIVVNGKEDASVAVEWEGDTFVKYCPAFPSGSTAHFVESYDASTGIATLKCLI